MRIAIVSSFGHMECLGFLLETLKHSNSDIFVYISDDTDKHKWIDYLYTVYDFTTICNLNINVTKYDKVIKITSHDNCLASNETISILHLKSLIGLNNASKKYISLSPYISGDGIHYMFPVFRPTIVNSYSNIVTFIGHCLNSHIDNDTDLFIQNNLDYTFIYIIWGDAEYSNLTKHANVKILHQIDTQDLVKIINQSKFILSRKYINYDRFSGQLGLAMSFEKPLLIDSMTASSYHLPGVIFDKSYSELGQLSNISDSSYEKIKEEIKIFNENTVKNNCEILNTLLH